jgi:putative transposase
VDDQGDQLDEWAGEAAPVFGRRRAWQPSTQVLAVISAHKTLRGAWLDLRTTDATSVPSYPRFTAAMRDYPDQGIAKALKGHGARDLIATRMYLQVHVAHRNSQWQLDSQEIPVFCIPSRGSRPVKVWQTTCIDAAHRILMSTLFTAGPPTAHETAACIAAGIRGRTYLLGGQEVFVGGIPSQIVWDNAKANLADVITELVQTLAFLGVPATPHAGWEKGKIESWHGISQTECYSTMPGYSYGPTSFSGAAYWGDHRSSEALLFSEDQLIAQAEHWAMHTYNTERIHGQIRQTPLASWAADSTPLRLATHDQLLSAMLTASRERTINKNGVHFDNVDYVAPQLNGKVGLKVRVRYLPGLRPEELFLEVFNKRGKWLCTAYPAKRLTAAQRGGLLALRRRQYEQLRTIEKQGARLRAERAARVKADGGTAPTYARPVSALLGDDLAADPAAALGDEEGEL